MGAAPSRWVLFLGILSILLTSTLVGLAGAQGPPPFTGQGGPFIPSSRSTTPQLLTPSNPLGAPGSAYGAQPGSDIIPLSSGMFNGIIPRISNLELGFLYNFGNNIRMGRFSADYVLPFSLSCDSVIFGEAHGEWENFWKTPTVSVTSVSGSTVTTSGSSNRVDLSFGGGYRTMLGESTLLGVNGFYDASRLFNNWYSSGGIGLEMAALLGGDSALDLNVNWYGNLFTRDGLINAFRNRGGSYDVEVGYSQSLFNQAVDLRLKATGYQFDIGSAVYGWRTGADLTTRDGVFSLKYEYGHDRVNGDYNTVGGFVNIGFQLENVLNGESPFTAPEPIFNSPRNLRRMLTQKAKRDWHQPTAVIIAKQNGGSQAAPGPKPLFIRTVFMGTAGSVVGTIGFLNQVITAADLAGVTHVIITWTGTGAPIAPQNFQLLNFVTSSLSNPALCNGSPGSTGLDVNDPLFWTPPSGSWDSFKFNNPTGPITNFGTVTLSFFP
jgi:Inverse autotransporter, beta-domain